MGVITRSRTALDARAADEQMDPRVPIVHVPLVLQGHGGHWGIGALGHWGIGRGIGALGHWGINTLV